MNELEKNNNENEIIEISEKILFDAKMDIRSKSTLSVPIAELATLGAGVASLLPEFRNFTQTFTSANKGLYELANVGVGDILKQAKDGNYWGAFKTSENTSKMLKIKEAGATSTTIKTVGAINPTTMMMAVALFSIERKLGEIEAIQKQIFNFLEIEKESEIEADVEMLTKILTKYKYCWYNEHYTSSNHKLILDIQRTARKNMNSYQKKVAEILKSKKTVLIQTQIRSTLDKLQKEFKYYNLALYTFSLSSMLEIMLSGNFKEENILGAKNEIEKFSSVYRDLFNECSIYLEKMSKTLIESNLVKGLGSASEAAGKLIGSIPHIKYGQVDEFLQESGDNIKAKAIDIQYQAIGLFASLSNPETRVFIEKMEEMILIYNHTNQICFDDENIYLIS